jgi:hypothetical protein
MRDTNFTIKITDLLKNTWSKDTLILQEKFSPDIEVTDAWISATVQLMWLNDMSILITLSNIGATIKKVCDRCGKIYEEAVFVDEVVLKGVVPSGEEDLIDEENEHCLIDTNDGSIDLHDAIVHTLKFCDHVVNNCPECAEIVASLEEENDDEIGSWPIIWKKN